tara:strand:- start:198 stop:602 length:405 start_codon:yes stop_codon:yes gene_type:complete
LYDIESAEYALAQYDVVSYEMRTDDIADTNTESVIFPFTLLLIVPKSLSVGNSGTTSYGALWTVLEEKQVSFPVWKGECKIDAFAIETGWSMSSEATLKGRVMNILLWNDQQGLVAFSGPGDLDIYMVRSDICE